MPRDARPTAYSDHTVALAAAVAYTAGDQVGGVQTLPRYSSKAGIRIQSMTILDRSGHRPGFDVYLFDTVPALSSTDNQPFSITAAELAKCAGVITFLKMDYAQAGACAVQSISDICLGMKVATDDFYAVAVCRNPIPTPFPLNAWTFRYHYELERV